MEDLLFYILILLASLVSCVYTITKIILAVKEGRIEYIGRSDNYLDSSEMYHRDKSPFYFWLMLVYYLILTIIWICVFVVIFDAILN